ncbi:cytochrome P450 [Streptomyces lichenis]|uniref:Cytochrome P450 n=1 Tax=Streptomyces lichenis TaxID=2306967 RepID=A0ABT0IC63_9ACTN|nr:cytochrome P450 [Streptomyces lichenis]MCK8678901.1 cytochrome P450 [Streptomyces lichenis]
MTASSPSDPRLPLRYPFPLGDNGRLPPLIRWAQRNRPVCPVAMPSGARMWMLTRRDDIAQVFADPRFSRDLDDPAVPRIAGQDITTISRGLFSLDPPDHTRVKSVVSGFFTRRAVRRYEELVAGHATALLDAMDDGLNPCDLVAAYTAPLQMRVMREVLGVPEELYEEHQRVFPSASSITAGPEETSAETEEIKAFTARVITARRDLPPRDDPMGALLRAADEGAISEQEMFGTAFVLFFTGSDAIIAPTTTGAMILILNPSQLRPVLDDPGLWPKAAEEVLRYFHNGVLGFPVVTREDVELHGVTIAAGDAVVASMQAATWDPRHVNNPEKFNVRRREDAAATFGAGPHYCLGAQLARLYLATALRLLFERHPSLRLAVAEQDVPWRNDIMFVRPVALPVSWSEEPRA